MSELRAGSPRGDGAAFGLPGREPSACCNVSLHRRGVRRYGLQEIVMGMASYKIEPYQSGWGVTHDGETVGPYGTKEAAFEATVAAASMALKEGHALEITAPGAEIRRSVA
jgi:hypothetical protein